LPELNFTVFLKDYNLKRGFAEEGPRRAYALEKMCVE
jgi:hypothetical protein